MAEHWPTALLLWSVGAAVGVYLLRQWPQVLWLAVLVPAWLWGEWTDAQPPHAVWRGLSPVAVGMFLLACAYLMAKPAESTARWRRSLAWLGAIALIPSGDCARDVERHRLDDVRHRVPGGDGHAAHGRLVGRHRAAVGARVVPARPRVRVAVGGARLGTRAHAGLAALGCRRARDVWITRARRRGRRVLGLRDQQRLAINVGVLGFALALVGFYFSSLYDKLGRALGLIGIGVLFIGGGWLLERARRRLIARLQAGRS